MWFAAVLAAAAAIALAVDIAVEGVDNAAGMAGVLVGFCELGALVLAVAGWASEHRESASPEPDADASAVETRDRNGLADRRTRAGRSESPVFIGNPGMVYKPRSRKIEVNVGEMAARGRRRR